MTVDLRSLYARVSIARGDVDGARIGWCIQEAVREVCRRTRLARVELTGVSTAGSGTYTPDLSVPFPSGAALLTVHRLRTRKTGTTDAYVDAAPIPATGAWGTTEESGTTTSSPAYFTQRGNTVHLYRAPSVDFDVMAEVSFVPGNAYWEPIPPSTAGSTSFVSLPEEAVNAIEAKAEHLLLRLPGPERDPATAQMRDRDYRNAIGPLIALAYTGESNVPLTGLRDIV